MLAFRPLSAAGSPHGGRRIVGMVRGLPSSLKRVMSMRATGLVLPIIPLLVLAILAAPGHAQQPSKITRIGVLGSVYSAQWDGFLQGLKELGYAEGRNIIVEWRWTEGKAERVPELAAELVRLKPSVIVTSAPQPTAAVKAATDTIAIVFIGVADPVQTGLVASLARPGGNITGLATLVPEGFASKMIELLQEAVPQASRVAILTNPTNAVHRRIVSTELPTAAERLRLTFLTIEAQAARNTRARLSSRSSRVRSPLRIRAPSWRVKCCNTLAQV